MPQNCHLSDASSEHLGEKYPTLFLFLCNYHRLASKYSILYFTTHDCINRVFNCSTGDSDKSLSSPWCYFCYRDALHHVSWWSLYSRLFPCLCVVLCMVLILSLLLFSGHSLRIWCTSVLMSLGRRTFVSNQSFITIASCI